ncbi:NIPSNAP family protein [Serratia sp. root2]|uniref:NIPSNAP family protein n=1 Tax=Serratia sp. root2 TaxID=3059676 RepID=UPI0028914704|nr:NIPSNAP family protein [Serratia sp. root2]MDT3250558.1 NIPSNAP family protein [Serratia sp. root2]
MENKTLEILTYTLKKGTGRDFHKIMTETSVPLHLKVGIDVVRFGNSLHDADSYFLIRAFDSVEHLENAQDEFYKSDAWRTGPRAAIIERIEQSIKSVLTISNAALDAMRV